MFGRGGGREVWGGHGGLVRIGIVVLAWTLDPDVLSLCPKRQAPGGHQKLLVLPMGGWVWRSARERHLSGVRKQCRV